MREAEVAVSAFNALNDKHKEHPLGDTIEVLHNQRPERIRLSGIDCPEKGQAYGKRAKQAASELVFGKDVTLQTHGKDKYGRTLADVRCSYPPSEVLKPLRQAQYIVLSFHYDVFLGGIAQRESQAMAK